MDVPQIRKMRCDDQPDGCASCRQTQTECKTTDRITGKATVRGYVESLEGRLAELEQYTHELRAQVRSLGGEVKPEPKAQNTTPIQQSQHPNGHHREDQQQSVSNGAIEDPPIRRCGDSQYSNVVQDTSSITGLSEYRIRLPTFRSGLSGNNYLGISSGNSLLSSVRGTSMNVLGMEIDLADYMSADVDEPDPLNADRQPVYNKSYRAFVQTAFGVSPKLNKVELPPRSEGFNYADIFFRLTSPYAPVVHRPTFIKLVGVIAFAHNSPNRLIFTSSLAFTMTQLFSLLSLRPS